MSGWQIVMHTYLCDFIGCNCHAPAKLIPQLLFSFGRNADISCLADTTDDTTQPSFTADRDKRAKIVHSFTIIAAGD